MQDGGGIPAFSWIRSSHGDLGVLLGATITAPAHGFSSPCGKKEAYTQETMSGSTGTKLN